MGLLSGLFDSSPDYVKDIKKKIEAYCLDLQSGVKKKIESDALYFAQNESNWNGIQEGYTKHKRDAEYYSLMFVYLACRDLLKSGHFHIYAGMVSMEGNVTYGVGCDCLDRMVQRGYITSQEAESSKSKMEEFMTDIGIG